MIRHIISYYWDESGTDEVTLSTTSYPYSPITFYFNSCTFVRRKHFIRLLIGRELDHLQKSYIKYATVRSQFVTLLLTNKTVRRLPCPFDGDCSAGRPSRS